MRFKFPLALPMLLSLLLLAACEIEETPVITPTPVATQPPAPSPTPGDDRLPAEDRDPIVVSPVGMDGVLLVGTDDMPWWNDAVFYEVFVRSFYDSDGDGVGDLDGLIQKLDYLNDGDPGTTGDLGVTGIWLMPVMQSSSYHGYDVVDYYTIDDEYGTNADFLRLIDEAHARGIHVIIDLVLNHTSRDHRWFQESLDPNSDRRDWYIWSDAQPEGPGWHPYGGSYYFGYFWEGMPDLNYNNPDVTAAMEEIVRFWLEDMRVDGFRLDAVKHLIEDGRVLENTPATHAWLEGFFDYYKDIDPDALTVGEIWSTTDVVSTYVGDEVDAAFEFDLAGATLESAVSGRKVNVERAQPVTVASFPPGQFASFLANHDQDRARSRFIVDDQATLAATLQLGFPGVPFLYYGEEIGMQGTSPDENRRRPMQWDASGGFTSGVPWNTYFDDYPQRHVAGQTGDPDSILSHYRALIRLRNTHEALRIGDWLFVETDHPSVYAYLRFSDEEIVLVLVNLNWQPVEEYNLSLPSGPLVGGLQPVLLLGEGDLYAPRVNGAGGFDRYRPLDSLAAYGSYVIQFVP